MIYLKNRKLVIDAKEDVLLCFILLQNISAEISEEGTTYIVIDFCLNYRNVFDLWLAIANKLESLRLTF